MRILVVEDDRLLAGSLERGLRAEGYAVDLASDGVEGLYRATEFDYDALVLDIALPGMNGYRVCEELRAKRNTTPILMLTAKDGVWDQEEGLDTGADDYLVKPFHYPVLLARIRALIRRGPARHPPVLRHGPLTIDPAKHTCTLSSKQIDLTPREFALLRYLIAHPGVTHTKRELLDHVWGEINDGDCNVVQVFVSALRHKVGPDLIETVRGVGYRISDEPL